MERIEQREKRFLVDGLGGAGQILVPLLERIGSSPSRTEQVDEGFTIESADFRRAIIPAVGNVVGMMPEIFQTEFERAVWLDTNQLTHLLEIARLSQGCQPHHFVFVAKVREPNE